MLPRLRVKPATALRATLAAGYSKSDLRADVMAGLVVGVVALPLSMALAIASGVPPQHGLYTAIIAGALIAALGGSRVQVSGPTAAFVVLLAPVAARYGVGGLCVASVIAGVMLVAMGAAGFGSLLQFVPHPVTTGFTAGIAVVIGTLQVKDFLGLTVEHMPEHFIERVVALGHAAHTARLADLLIGAFTLAVLIVWPRIDKRLPAPLVALTLGALAAFAATHLIDGITIDTIASRFTYVVDGVTKHGVPQAPPLPVLPWLLPGADGAPLGLSLQLLRDILPSAFAIAMLGAIESLLSATVADGMIGAKHDSNAELLGQGIGNIVAPFFGGFAATGAIARTATSVRSGARSPIAAMTHALFVLAAVLVIAPLVGYLPMASLAALLLIVAWNMSEVRHFGHILRVAPRADVVVLLACFVLTVVFDMVISVTAGVMLAALLFMRRMADISGGRLEESHSPTHGPLPKGVLHYSIDGPLFFGAAQKAMGALHDVARTARVVIIEVADVPAMDATGLVALESALAKLWKDKAKVIIAGAQAQPRAVLERAGLVPEAGKLKYTATLGEAIEAARAAVAAVPQSQPPHVEPNQPV
ncbi:MAG: C4-dicarboxylic acid transporter DauA [Deltaproteobacteria bacterium]|nr:C4-dicarboxylic acid transporter DauA [Deltaproteobacteria bacterium]